MDVNRLIVDSMSNTRNCVDNNNDDDDENNNNNDNPHSIVVAVSTAFVFSVG